MNNSKLIKLISTIVVNSSEIKLCKVKPIWDDKEPYWQLLFTENTQFGFDFYDSAMEATVSEKPSGWYAYKEIHWLDFPSIVNNEGKTKNTQQKSLSSFVRADTTSPGSCTKLQILIINQHRFRRTIGKSLT